MGEKQKLCLVRFLNNTVMVRVGGGWVTLSEFLENNDPCKGKRQLETNGHPNQSWNSSSRFVTIHFEQLNAHFALLLFAGAFQF